MNPSAQYVHTSPRIAGCTCDGCLRLEVRIARRKMIYTEKYWCLQRHGYFEPKKIGDCDMRLEEHEIRQARFNSWHVL